MAGLAGTEEGTWVGRCGAGEFGWLEPPCVAHTHTPSGSEHSRDDGKGHGGAAGLQLQGGQEALGGRCIVALSLQDLPQPVPHLVGRGVDLHGVSKDLLGQAVAAQLVEDQGQALHAPHMRGADGQGLFIPALRFVTVPSELGHLASHVQHIVGHREEVGGLLGAGGGLCGLPDADVDLSCMEPDLRQCHPGVQWALLGGAALQRGGHFRQRLLHSGGCDRGGVDGACLRIAEVRQGDGIKLPPVSDGSV